MTTGQLSKRGAGACIAHEAIYLYGYPDPGTNGKPYTIGAGHTDAAGPPTVRLGDKITLQRAFEIYAADMVKYENGVRQAIRVELEQHEFDAAVSFHFNTGAIRTGSIDEKLNRGDRAGAMATWLQYNKAGGRVMRGLVTRRQEEVALFRTGTYPSRQILLRETPTSTPRRLHPDNIPWRDGAVPVKIELQRPLPPTPVQPPKPAPAAQTVWTAIARWLRG